MLLFTLDIFAFYQFVGYFVNIFWKIRENFTVGGFRECRSITLLNITIFALFRILEECYFINMRIFLHHWECMGAGFFFTRKKCLRHLIFCFKIVSFSKIRTSGRPLYQKSVYGNDYYHAFAFINNGKVPMEVFEVFNTFRGTLRMLMNYKIMFDCYNIVLIPMNDN